jgi:hypothetical protein
VAAQQHAVRQMVQQHVLLLKRLREASLVWVLLLHLEASLVCGLLWLRALLMMLPLVLLVCLHVGQVLLWARPICVMHLMIEVGLPFLRSQHAQLVQLLVGS